MEKLSIKLNGLTYDDVFIRPGRTSIAPSSVSLKSEVLRGHTSNLPIMPAPMSTVFSRDLRRQLANWHILAPVPREAPYAEILRLHQEDSSLPLLATTSPFREGLVRELLADIRIKYLILDTVAAHHDSVFKLLDSLPDHDLQKIVVGNIATGDAARDYSRYPIAGIKVGLGLGSICTTSVVTGVGMPQLQAIAEVKEAMMDNGAPIIADGGIQNSGDIAKALAAGASAVMMGKLFAATTEAAGVVRTIEGQEYKLYEGAEYATIEFSPDSEESPLATALTELNRKGAHRSEGVSGLLKHTGPVSLLLAMIERALSASFAFVGAKDIASFRECAQFQPASPFAMRQGRPHGIDILTRSNQLMDCTQ